jgi:hypothetical protein
VIVKSPEQRPLLFVRALRRAYRQNCYKQKTFVLFAENAFYLLGCYCIMKGQTNVLFMEGGQYGRNYDFTGSRHWCISPVVF